MATGVFRSLLFCTLTVIWFFIAQNAGFAAAKDLKPFLTASISNNRPFVGQEVLLTYTLCFRDTAPKISEEVPPSLRGVWVKEAKPERYIRSTPVTIKGEQLRSAVVKQFKVVPLQSGPITIAGYSMNCSLPSDPASFTGSDIPDVRFLITAPGVDIVARPLPGNAPKGFSGAVGTFSLELTADRQNLKAREALTMKIILSGTGNLLTLTMPDLRLPVSFRRNQSLYTDALKNEPGISSGSVISTIQVWPQSAGDYQVPSASMDIFNPETGKFHSIISKPLTIHVSPAAQTETENNSDISGTIKKQSETPFFLRPLTIAVGIIILVMISFVSFSIWNKNRRSYPGRKQADIQLEIERGQSAESMKKAIFALIEKAGISSPCALTRNELKKELLKTGVPESLLNELPEMLDSLDRIIYSTAGEKKQVIPESVIGKIDLLLNTLNKIAVSN
jgi:hypothetical protein